MSQTAGLKGLWNDCNRTYSVSFSLSHTHTHTHTQTNTQCRQFPCNLHYTVVCIFEARYPCKRSFICKDSTVSMQCDGTLWTRFKATFQHLFSILSLKQTFGSFLKCSDKRTRQPFLHSKWCITQVDKLRLQRKQPLFCAQYKTLSNNYEQIANAISMLPTYVNNPKQCSQSRASG